MRTDCSFRMASEEPQNVDIVVPPDLEIGVYANVAAVSTQTPHDITLDFIQMVPGTPAPRAVVVARLKLAPTFLMPLMQVLSNHLTRHEQIQRQAQQTIFPEQPQPPADEEGGDQQ